jgi:hypothetical protein
MMRLNQRPKFSFDDVMEFGAPELYDVLRLWEEKRGSRELPSKSDLTPFALKNHLGCIVVVRGTHSPLAFRFSLHGSKIVDVVGRDITGMSLEEAFEGEALRKTRALGEHMVRTKRPVRMHSTVVPIDKDFLEVETIFLPLAADGTTVDTLLGRQVFF